MFGRLDRYIGLTVAKATGMALLALVILLLLFNVVDELDRVNRGGYRVLDALLVALLIVPRYLFEVFPVSALLGSLLGLGGLATGSELVAMRAAGFSVRNIAFSVLKVGMLMMLVVGIFGELVAPPAERYAQQLRAERLSGQPTLSSRFGFWARDRHAFINIRRPDGGRRPGDIYIYEFDGEGRLHLISHADLAEFRDNHWILRGIEQSELSSQRVKARRLSWARWDTTLDPALLRVVEVRPTMLPIWDLYDYIGFMRSNGQSASDYEVAFWLKVVNPVATLAMLFLAVPLVVGHVRAMSIGQRIFTGAVIGAAFFLVNRALSYMSVVYGIPPALSAFLPSLVLVGVTAFLLRRVR